MYFGFQKQSKDLTLSDIGFQKLGYVHSPDYPLGESEASSSSVCEPQSLTNSGNALGFSEK